MFAEDHHPEPMQPRNAWLVTFADVIALLLAFFVMLFSMSNIKTETWNVIISQISSSETPEKQENRDHKRQKMLQPLNSMKPCRYNTWPMSWRSICPAIHS